MLGNKLLIAVTFATGLFVSMGQCAARADQPEKAATFLGEVARQVIAVIEAKDVDEAVRIRRYRSIFDRALDVDFVAQTAAGPHWRRMKSADRVRYLRVFRDHIVRIYSRRFGGHDGTKFTIVSSLVTSPTDSIVYARITSPNISPTDTSFRIRNNKGNPRIVDVSVKGISLVLTKRSEFNSIIYHKGISGLLDILSENKSDQIKKRELLRGL